MFLFADTSPILATNKMFLFRDQMVVLLIFHEPSKIILTKYTMPEITFLLRISSWNCVCVSEAWLWAHMQSFNLKFSTEVWFFQKKVREYSKELGKCYWNNSLIKLWRKQNLYPMASGRLIWNIALVISCDTSWQKGHLWHDIKH